MDYCYVFTAERTLWLPKSLGTKLIYTCVCVTHGLCVCVSLSRCVCQDPVSLKRFLKKEAVRELPSEEEPWEVAEPIRPELPYEGGEQRGGVSTMSQIS